MKCTCCGKELLSTDRFCSNCGQNNESYVEPVESNVIEKQTIQQPINRVPINNQSYNNQNYNSNYAQNNYQQPQIIVQQAPESSGIAIAALIFGLLGGWLGLVFGIVGLSKYKESGNRTMCAIGIFAWIVEFIIFVVLYSTVWYKYL